MGKMSIDRIGEYIGAYQKGGKVAVITDETVAELYLSRIASGLMRSGFTGSAIIIPPGEDQKNGKVYLSILDRLAECGITRADGIVALGGGVITDIAGFAASTYMRGVALYNVPTTLLGMVDAAIGGKNGVDIPAGKNMAGSFYEPTIVLKDTATLGSLNDAQFREGMAEVIKYAMISDSTMFDVLEGMAAGGRTITGADEAGGIIDAIVGRCGEIKEQYVKADMYDHCTRRILNFGHTIGHALEVLSDYSLPHGNAVAKGMNFMTQLAASAGWCDGMTAYRLERLLDAYGYDLSLGVDEAEMLEKIGADKKRSANKIDFITPDAIGKCRIRRLEIEEFKRLCKERK